MGKVARLFREGVEAGSLRLAITRALPKIGDHPKEARKRELHVSDFTMRDEAWCIRTLLRRWQHGDTRSNAPTEVQIDGKWREEKWRQKFEAGGILKEYQASWHAGPLVGHPDFILNWGFGNRVIELTGHDSKIDFRLLSQRVAVKKRQHLLYQVLGYASKKDIRLGGYVIVEDKGNNTYKIHSVPWDVEKAAHLVQRVLDFLYWLRRLQALNSSLIAQRRVWRSIPRCGKKRCEACDGQGGRG